MVHFAGQDTRLNPINGCPTPEQGPLFVEEDFLDGPAPGSARVAGL